MSVNNSIEQNGRLPISSIQTTLPNARARTLQAPSDQPNKIICRDFVWGICNKGTQCKYRHDLDFETMKDILRFCHDYQNRTGCMRPDCNYIHCSREEENLFLDTGQIPRVLAERYAAMSSAPITTAIESGPPPVPIIYMAQPPPPPPPVGLAPPPPPVGMAPPPLPAPISTLLAPPPPPPPPTIQPASTTSTKPVYTAPPPANPPVIFTQPPPSFPMFDATKPPPTHLPNTQIKNNTDKKRPAEISEAGPCKARKLDVPKVDSVCEECMQREVRIGTIKQKMQKLQCTEECQWLMVEKKSEEYENGKLLIRSVVSPELYHILEDYIEGTSQPSQINDIFQQTSSFSPGISTLPKNLLLQLLYCVLGSSKNVVETVTPPSPSLNLDEALLSGLGRKPTNSSPDMFNTLLKLLSNSSEPSERRAVFECRTNELVTVESSSLSNGLSNMSDSSTTSQSRLSADAPGRTYAGVNTESAPLAGLNSSGAIRYPNATNNVSAIQPVIASDSGAVPSNPQLEARATPAYLPYPPNVPPPPGRPFYPQSYPGATTSMSNNVVSPSPIARGMTPQTAPRPHSSTALPPPPPNNIQNYPYMVRYPMPPQYYPPYQ